MIRFSYPPDTEPGQNRAIPREGRAASPASAWLGARLIVPTASRSALPVCAAVLALAEHNHPARAQSRRMYASTQRGSRQPDLIAPFTRNQII